jgi:hypothetical protein
LLSMSKFTKCQLAIHKLQSQKYQSGNKIRNRIALINLRLQPPTRFPAVQIRQPN